MNYSKGSCDGVMSSDMLCAQDFWGFTMNHSNGSCDNVRGSCDDVMSSDISCAQEFFGGYDESLDRVFRRCERVLRRCDVARHLLCPRLLGAYDESFERVWRRCERVLRRCDVARHLLCPAFWGLTMNHSKGSGDDVMSPDMLCAQDCLGGLR